MVPLLDHFLMTGSILEYAWASKPPKSSVLVVMHTQLHDKSSSKPQSSFRLRAAQPQTTTDFKLSCSILPDFVSQIVSQYTHAHCRGTIEYRISYKYLDTYSYKHKDLPKTSYRKLICRSTISKSTCASKWIPHTMFLSDLLMACSVSHWSTQLLGHHIHGWRKAYFYVYCGAL